MAIVRIIGALFSYFCIATVIAQSLGLVVLLGTRQFTKDEVYEILAIVYKIDTDELKDGENGDEPPREDQEEPDWQTIIDARAQRHLALDFRIQALDTGIENMRAMQVNLVEERRRYDQLKDAFDQRLEALANGVRDDAIIEVQRTLESVDPRQAKEQILIMLERDKQSMTDVVKIIKAMPTDKRKRIMGEFRTPEEEQKLADILNEIRLGVPDAEVIREARNHLQKFNPERS